MPPLEHGVWGMKTALKTALAWTFACLYLAMLSAFAWAMWGATGVGILAGTVLGLVGIVWVWDKLDWSLERTGRAFWTIVIYTCIIGAILFYWHPPEIWDVPLARLTLAAIAENIAKVLILVTVGGALLQSLAEL